jgi:hypothetical protein
LIFICLLSSVDRLFGNEKEKSGNLRQRRDAAAAATTPGTATNLALDLHVLGSLFERPPFSGTLVWYLTDRSLFVYVDFSEITRSTI